MLSHDQQRMLGVTLLEQLMVLMVALGLLTVSVRHFLQYQQWSQQALLRTDLTEIQLQARDYFYANGCDLRGRFRGNTKPSLPLLGLEALQSGRAPWINHYQVQIILLPTLATRACRAWLRIVVSLTPQGSYHHTRLLASLPNGSALSATQLQWQNRITPTVE